MGYRSDIAISMRKEDFELLQEFDKENRNLVELLEVAEVKESRGAVAIKWDSLKWYPDFPEVQAIEEFLGKLSDEDKPYRFIRIGEAIDDTEVEYNYGDEEKYGDISYRVNDMIGVERYISTYID